MSHNFLNSVATGDYLLHLNSVQAMHPFFAASGHNNYAKSIQVYLQDMQKLHETNPDVHRFFSDGNFVTRRTNRYWGGLPDDLVIEQVDTIAIMKLYSVTFFQKPVKTK